MDLASAARTYCYEAVCGVLKVGRKTLQGNGIDLTVLCILWLLMFVYWYIDHVFD